MEAEEIIQQKEWWQITNDERILLQPLAANEDEFNLLKKMLQISATNSFDVPVINPQIQHLLRDAINEKKKKPIQFKWQYAAAVLLFIGIGIWLFTAKTNINLEPNANPIAKNNPIIEQIEKQINTAKENKETDVLKDSNEKKIATIPIKKHVQKIRKAAANQYDEYITSISSDTTLLAYITEVY